MDMQILKLKKKERKRLEKLVWKKAEQSDALPMNTLASAKRSRTASK